jgi:CheY-like chemotaxis protein
MKLMEMTLRDKGYILVKASDGETALATAVAERPDLLLLDVRIPKLDGFEVAKRLRQRPEFKTTPIIALTAHAMRGDQDKVIEAGCDIYLSKPIDTRQLPLIVEQALEKGGRK